MSLVRTRRRLIVRRRLRPVLSRRRLPEPLEFEGKIKKWALSYLKKNHWRLKSLLDTEDLESEAFMIFWRLRQKYGYSVLNVDEFMKIYSVALYFHVSSLAKTCFPNPYNFGSEGGSAISLTGEDGGDILEKLSVPVCNSSEKLEECLDILKKIPWELQDVCSAIMREVCGIEEIRSLCRRHLNGGWSMESLNQSLSRIFGFQYRRNVLRELTETILSLPR